METSKSKPEKHQAIFISGGEVFDNKEDFYTYLKRVEYNPYQKRRTRKDRLERSLSWRFDSFIPKIPNKQRADYKARKIRFEKFFPYINPSQNTKIILAGHSLWWIFLTKYLSENKFPKHIDQLHLIAPVFDNEWLTDPLWNFEFNPDNLQNIRKQSKKIFFYHSEDDPAVPITHTEKYLQYLPEAKFYKFKDRWHFNQPAFMEILQNINANL